ncbi:MAG: thioredoxin family protein [Armatimonadota bacterium]
MKLHLVLTISIVVLLAGTMAVAQEACDFTNVGKDMESAAAQGDWAAAYEHAQVIVAAQPDDLSTLSAEHQYFIGLAHAYMAAEVLDGVAEGVEGDRAEFVSRVMEAVRGSTADADIRTVSHGERVELEDYLVDGKTVLFDFTSKYCPPCEAIAPSLERLATEREDIVLVKVDINRPDVQGIDWQSPVAQQHGIRGVPHFKIFGPDGALEAEGGAARTMVINWLNELEG